MVRHGEEYRFKSIIYTLIKFSLPLILSGILQQLYNWVDAFIVGNVEGELALAAIGATGTVVNFYLMAINGFTLGLAILFGQKYGSGDTGGIPKILSGFSAILGMIFSVLAILGIVLAFPILNALHTTPETVQLAGSYLQIIFFGVPFLAVYNVYSAALRGIGDSRAPFLAVLVSSVVNVLLDIVFVALLHWGVAGAAAATILSQAAMTLFIIIYATKKHALLRFQFSREIFNRDILALGLHFGLPPMIQSSVSSCGSLLLQNFMNGFGTQTVAAITTAYRVDSILLLPIINLGSGISTLVAQSHGAGDEKRAKKTFGAGIVLMVIVSLSLTLLIVSAGGYLIALFGVGAGTVEIGFNFFRRIAAFYVVFGLATAVRGYLEGNGDILYSSITGIIALATRIVASYAFASFCGNMIIAYAEAFSWGVLLVMYFGRMYFRKERKKPNR